MSKGKTLINTEWLIGKRVRIFWARDSSYKGNIVSFEDKKYKIKYDDGDVKEYSDLFEKRMKFIFETEDGKEQEVASEVIKTLLQKSKTEIETSDEMVFEEDECHLKLDLEVNLTPKGNKDTEQGFWFADNLPKGLSIEFLT